MKILFLLGVFVLVAATAATEEVKVVDNVVKTTNDNASVSDVTGAERNILINALIRQMFAFLRRIIREGSDTFNLPPTDPLIINQVNLNVPAILINFDLAIQDGLMTGLGDFVVHRSNLNLRDLSFELDMSFPIVTIKAGHYNINGDLYNAIPFYGAGEADLVIENFRFAATLWLKQSDDENSIIVDRVEGPSFSIERLRSDFTGIIGGGDIDQIANAIIEEVILDYINRLNRPVALVAGQAAPLVLNQVLGRLNTWRFIAPFV